MAFHRGDVTRLNDFLRRDPGLTERRFSCREIYPSELGCAKDGRCGMHWTPIDGTTLLHLAIDFDEEEVFDLLLAHGAGVDARGKQGCGRFRRAHANLQCGGESWETSRIDGAEAFGTGCVDNSACIVEKIPGLV